MTDKEFRRLSRSELIDIIFEYQKQEAKMKSEIKELKKKLEDRDLKIENVGSIAEAVVSLNEVFENAQRTADSYLQYVYDKARKTEDEAKALLAEAEKKAEKIIADAKKKAKD